MNYDTLTVVQGNDLLEGAYGVTLDEMRLLNLALAQIDSRKPQPDMLYTLYPRDYQRIYGVNPTSIVPEIVAVIVRNKSSRADPQFGKTGV